MDFQEQSDKLSRYLKALPVAQMAAPPVWQLERDGQPGFFLNSPGITLADAEHFLMAVLGSSELLHSLAPSMPGEELSEAALPLPLENLRLDWLTLTETEDGDGHELKLLLVWETHTATVALLDDPKITFDLVDIEARIDLRRSHGPVDQQQTEVVLAAKMHFNDLEFELDAQLPALIFEATLSQPAAAPTDSATKQGDKHGALIGTFMPSVPADSAPQLESLALIFALRQRRAIFHFAVANLFDLKPLALRGLQADIIYDASAGRPSGRLWGDVAIDLGGDRGSIEMLLLAELAADRTWQFVGQTGPDGIVVGDLLGALATMFPGDDAPLTLPDAIAHLEIVTLGLAYNTGTQVFGFNIEVKFRVAPDEPEVDIVLQVDVAPNEPEVDIVRQVGVAPAGTGHTTTVRSTIHFAGHAFDIAFAAIAGDGDTTTDVLVAEYSHPTTIALPALIATITNAEIADLIPPLSVKLDQVRFAYVKQGQKSAALFGVSLEAKLSLTDLPLVGAALPAGIGLEGIQVLYVSADVSAPQAAAINSLLPPTGQLPAPQATAAPAKAGAVPTALPHGFNFAAHVNLGSGTMPLLASGQREADATPATETTALPAKATAPASSAATPPTGNVTWIDVQRSLGPMIIKRVGGRYAGERLWLLFSADLTLSTFTIGLQGLGIGFKVGQWDDIEPTLTGLSLTYAAGPVEISGAFEKLGEDFLGAATIKTGSYSLSAIGAYGKRDGETSLFIYAMLTDPPLGGPSFFYVTGLAAGFGYNRDVRVPTPDEMTKFPLVSAMMPESKDAVMLKPDASDPLKTLEQISAGGWIPKAPGQNWLAVGVRFTSFEMVQSFALATVKFGTRFEVGIVGLSQLTIPGPDPKTGAAAPDRIAYAEVAFTAVLIPDEGILRVDGKLTPASYILVKEARLTGGFAFYVWFDGDFVISFGGYHPHFDQGHYPDVPRLRIDFHIGSSLHVTAQAYFALTPSAVMAGGHLKAVWDGGPLQAWFSTGADFLLQWKPFHYEAQVRINIGASFTLDFSFFSVSVTVELGAELTLWGPPLGGTATISYSIASFTLGFGADRPDPPALTWPQFRDQFLPLGQPASASDAVRNGALLTALVTEGLVKDLTQAHDQVGEHDIAWVVNSAHVVIEARTAVPATALTFNGTSLPAAHYAEPLHVGPMRENGKHYTAPYAVAVEYHNPQADDPAHEWTPYDQVTAEPIVGKSPKALWSDYNPMGAKQPLSQAQSTLEGTLLGIRIRPRSAEPEETPAFDLKDLLFEEHQIEGVAMFEPVPAFANQSTRQMVDVSATIVANSGRDVILQALHDAQIIDPPTAVHLTGLGQRHGALNAQSRVRSFRTTSEPS